MRGRILLLDLSSGQLTFRSALSSDSGTCTGRAGRWATPSMCDSRCSRTQAWSRLEDKVAVNQPSQVPSLSSAPLHGVHMVALPVPLAHRHSGA